MAFIVDIVLVAVLALCIFFGWKNGFVKAISGFLTYILSFAIANLCWKWIAGFVGTIPFIKNMVTGTCSRLARSRKISCKLAFVMIVRSFFLFGSDSHAGCVPSAWG